MPTLIELGFDSVLPAVLVAVPTLIELGFDAGSTSRAGEVNIDRRAPRPRQKALVTHHATKTAARVKNRVLKMLFRSVIELMNSEDSLP